MKKIIKKILTFVCTLILCIVCLTGCSWLQIDRYKYYNDVVVTVGDKKFYKKDLIEAFSNYGYQYYQEYGMSLEESINYTINSMIDRWLLLQEVKKDETIVRAVESEALSIKQQAFDYMQDSIYTYEEKIRKEWGINLESESTEEDSESSLRTSEEDYTPSTYYEVVEELVDGQVKLVGKVFRNEESKDDTVIIGENLKLTDNFDKSKQVITDKKVSDEAWTRYVKSLQDAAKGEGRDESEKAVLLHEEERLIELLTNNLYLEKFEEMFESKHPVDIDKVLEYYMDQYLAEKEAYNANENLYHTAMKEASSEYVYFHPNSGNEYVRVKHILINFTDAQKEAIKALKTEYGITDDNSEEDEERKKNNYYQNRLNAIVRQTTSTFEMTDKNGNKVTKTWNALVTDQNNGNDIDNDNNVYEYVQDYVTGATLKEKCQQFNELVYIFNDDSGFMNSEFDYVVNLDTEVEDQMVKPFANGVRELNKIGEGAMDYVVTEYGIHIIFHAGTVKNIVDESNYKNIFNNPDELLRLLCNTYTTPESNKSIFNYIYEAQGFDDEAYNKMSQNKINTARTSLKNNGVEIELYEKNYKDLFE